MSVTGNIGTQWEFLSDAVEPLNTLVIGIIILLVVSYKSFILLHSLLQNKKWKTKIHSSLTQSGSSLGMFSNGTVVYIALYPGDLCDFKYKIFILLQALLIFFFSDWFMVHQDYFAQFQSGRSLERNYFTIHKQNLAFSHEPSWLHWWDTQVTATIHLATVAGKENLHRYLNTKHILWYNLNCLFC